MSKTLKIIILSNNIKDINNLKSAFKWNSVLKFTYKFDKNKFPFFNNLQLTLKNSNLAIDNNLLQQKKLTSQTNVINEFTCLL